MLDRIMGVVTLKAPVYRGIADDQSATSQAGIIVVIVSLISGFFSGLVSVNTQTGATSVNIVGAVISAIVGLIFGLIAWVVAAWVLQFVAKMLGGKTDTGEMMRVTGYVQIFGLVSILNVLALAGTALSCVTGLLGFVVAILSLIGYIIGVREAAEFSTGNAVITAVIAAIVNFIIIAIPTAIVAFVLIALGMAAGG
ncbi:MAG: YIP1 family protein [Chloroflexi bacterium]|nr:YIP1 family protein [Chloroflexota bacterium]